MDGKQEFSPDVLLAAIRECVTVVGPGEVLAVRLDCDLTDEQWDTLTRDASGQLGVRVLFLPGDEFARIKPADIPRKAGAVRYWVLIADEVITGSETWPHGWRLIERGAAGEPGSWWWLAEDDGAPAELEGKRVSPVFRKEPDGFVHVAERQVTG